MDEDYDGFGFRLERYGATCCDRRVRLDELHYDWPMGFARFVVDVADPDVAVVSSGDETMMADAMGCQVRFVWQRV